MKLVKAMTVLKMARSRTEAETLIKQGAVFVGGCIPPCNARMPPFKCVCGGWKKAMTPAEELEAGTVVRVGDGNWRLLVRKNEPGFDQVIGIGRIPEED